MQFEPNDLSELDELTEEHLGFSALSGGLGFAKSKGPHPATTKGQNPPAAKAPPAPTFGSRGALPSMDLDEEEEQQLHRHYPQGAGATAAGPAAWATPQKPTPTWSAANPDAPQRPMPSSSSPGIFPSKPAATLPASPRPFSGVVPAASRPTAISSPAQTAARVASAAAAAAPSAAQVLAEPAAPQAVRLAAFMLDAFLILIPLTVAWFVSFGADAKEIFLLDPKSPLLLFAAIFSAYFLLSESFGGQSLGKMAFALQVVEDDKYQKPTGLRHAFVRLVLVIVGTACAGLGLLASFSDTKRRPWHDRYTGSIVRRRA